MKLEDLATGSWMVVAAAFGGLALKVAEWATRTLRAARRSDMDVAVDLRDALWKQVDRLSREVSDLRTRAEGCEAHARECTEENLKLREHAEHLAERVSQLEARR